MLKRRVRFMLCSMKLYNYFRSSASFRVRIALELKGLAYEYVAVHLGRGEHLSADFAALSVDALVPVLEVDGTRITQSMAIIEYLEDAYPGPALLPADALGRARVRGLAQAVACEMHPLNNMRVQKYLASDLHADPAAVSAWYHHWCRAGLLAFEQQLAAGPAGTYCHGDTPGLADCLLVPQWFNALRFEVDVQGLPRTQAVLDACMALPAFQRAQPSACPDYAA